MPIPQPSASESENEFISRCMSDEGMQKEFPRQQQRLAVCYEQLRDESSSDKRGETSGGRQ